MKTQNKNNSYENPIAKLLFVFGILIISAGLIAGCVVMVQQKGTSIHWIIWGIGAVVGILFIGLAEIIHLLNTIKNKL